jgi:hypothetical protein
MYGFWSEISNLTLRSLVANYAFTATSLILRSYPEALERFGEQEHLFRRSDSVDALRRCLESN